jgi:hypothetical protein
MFLLSEAIYILADGTGPLFDEGVHVTAGLRALSGFGIADSYLTWIGGSLLWPMLAGAAFQAAGLLGVRFVGACFTAIALAAIVAAARNLLGVRAAYWTALTLALNGPFLAIAHVGVPELGALACIAMSFWSITELVRRDHRVWLLVATFSFGAGAVAYYPAALSAVPLAVLLRALRGRRATVDLAVFGYVSAALFLIYYLPLREQLSATLRLPAAAIDELAARGPEVLLRPSLLYVAALPTLLATLGGSCLIAQRFQGAKRLGASLAVAAFAWPLALFLAGNRSDVRIVLGLAFAYPLIGYLLASAWHGLLPRLGVVATVLLLTVVGREQLTSINQSWPDIRAGSSYLAQHVKPDDRLLINSSWPYTMYLYANGNVRSPWDIYDPWRLEESELAAQLCEFDWFVDDDGPFKWPDSTRDAIMECRAFDLSFATTVDVTGVGPILERVTFPVQTRIWRNTATLDPATLATRLP